MADPISAVAIIGAGASAVGGITGAVGAETKGQSEANMYQYQAGVAQVNAQIAKQDANYAIEGGEVSAQEAGLKSRAEIGSTRAAFGASNISGASQNRVVSSEIEVGQQTQGIIQANAAKRAYGYSVTAAEDVAQAGAFQAAAETSKTAGDIGAVSSILGGVGSVSSKWLQSGPAFGGTGAGITDASNWNSSLPTGSLDGF